MTLILWVFPPCSYTIMNGNYLREFLTRLIMNYPIELFLSSNLVIKISNRYCPIDFLPA
jgi:hypothetical protein